jgi:hypothetical protein
MILIFFPLNYSIGYPRIELLMDESNDPPVSLYSYSFLAIIYSNVNSGV